MIDRRDQLKAQARHDLRLFLTLRAEEFKAGAPLVLSFVSAASSGMANYAPLVDACRTALMQMLREGRIPPAVARAFEVPTYDRSLEEVHASLDEVKHLWKTEDVFEAEVEHPAFGELQRETQKKDPNNNADAKETSRQYAQTVVDWMMAVVSGYFVKALRQGFGKPLEEMEEAVLVREWRQRTTEVFLDKHRDARVSCWFIYVKLVRM